MSSFVAKGKYWQFAVRLKSWKLSFMKFINKKSRKLNRTSEFSPTKGEIQSRLRCSNSGKYERTCIMWEKWAKGTMDGGMKSRKRELNVKLADRI